MHNFSKEYDTLNDAQREAVMYGEGPLLVIAGPGSGKTKVLTNRTLFLIEEKGVPPEKLLVITFTKAAAISMQQRFGQLSSRHYPVNFGTFHACFYHILQASQSFGSGRMLGEETKRHLLLPLIKKYITKKEEEWQDTLQEMLSAISIYKNTEDRKKAQEVLSEEYRPYFDAIFTEYETIRKQKKMLDFDDMVYECYQLLDRNINLRRYWQNRFDAILIDEFQDINPMQYKVLRLLAGDHTQMFAVGDDDQAIYGFRGSAPESMQAFKEDFGAEQITLNDNYRSTGQIIQAAFSVIGENKNRINKLMQNSCVEQKRDAVKLLSFQDREEEYRYLMKKISQCSDKQCAVLFRTNAYMQSFALRLAREGIPYVMKEKENSLYDHFVAKDIMAYLQLAHCGYSRAAYLRIMNKPFRNMDQEALFWGNGKNECLERQLENLKEMSLHLGIRYICKGIGYDSYLRKLAAGEEEKYLDWALICELLAKDAANYETYSQWILGQKEKGKKPISEWNNGRNARKEPVQLLTAHGAKGLEFEYVWLPDCNEKIYPHGSMVDEKTCEEERRLFYVAMTRAKENLELLYLVGTKERPRFPSRFLNPLLIPQPARQTHSCPDTHQKHLLLSRIPRHPQ